MSAKRSSHAGHRRWLALAIAIGIASGLSGCASGRRTRRHSSSSGTLRVAMTVSTWSGLDPQGTWGFNQWELLRCCLLRTLMTYRGVPDSLGTVNPQISPRNLHRYRRMASWTFRLRPGIHYGPPFENVEVTAADIVRALLRSDGEEADGPGGFYLPTIEGFSRYYAGGLPTRSPASLQPPVHAARADCPAGHVGYASLRDGFHRPDSSSAQGPDIRFGAATGHPFIFSPEEGVTERGIRTVLVPTARTCSRGLPISIFLRHPRDRCRWQVSCPLGASKISTGTSPLFAIHPGIEKRIQTGQHWQAGSRWRSPCRTPTSSASSKQAPSTS